MLLNLFKIRDETAVLNWGSVKRPLAAIVCISVLSGCDSVPDMPSYDEMKTGLSSTYDSTVSSIDKAWNDADSPGNDPASQKEVIVSLDRKAAKRLQTRLGKLGYPSGRPDGLIGSKTTRAIKRYQSAHSLPVTGKVSLQFLEHLEDNTAASSSRTILTNSPKY